MIRVTIFATVSDINNNYFIFISHTQILNCYNLQSFATKICPNVIDSMWRASNHPKLFHAINLPQTIDDVIDPSARRQTQRGCTACVLRLLKGVRRYQQIVNGVLESLNDTCRCHHIVGYDWLTSCNRYPEGCTYALQTARRIRVRRYLGSCAFVVFSRLFVRSSN